MGMVQNALLGIANDVTNTVSSIKDEKEKSKANEEYLAGLTKARELQNAAEISKIDSQIAGMEGGIKQTQLAIEEEQSKVESKTKKMNETQALRDELDFAANSQDFIGPRMPQHTAKQKEKIKGFDFDLDTMKEQIAKSQRRIKDKEIQIETTRKHIEAKQAERAARAAKQETKKGQ